VTDHHLNIVPLSKQHWIVRYEGDVSPVAKAPTLQESRAEACSFARQFGEPVIHVHVLDGECHTEHVDPDFQVPTPRDVKGPYFERAQRVELTKDGERTFLRLRDAARLFDARIRTGLSDADRRPAARVARHAGCQRHRL
jgi:nucleotide-binding universal stress UspA family protein